jgi:hypothetical protein
MPRECRTERPGPSFTPSEMREIEALANAIGLSVTETIRSSVLMRARTTGVGAVLQVGPALPPTDPRKRWSELT